MFVRVCVCVCVYLSLHSVRASVGLWGCGLLLDWLAPPTCPHAARSSSHWPGELQILTKPNPSGCNPAWLWPPVDCPARPFFLCQQLRAALCLRTSSSHHSQKTPSRENARHLSYSSVGRPDLHPPAPHPSSCLSVRCVAFANGHHWLSDTHGTRREICSLTLKVRLCVRVCGLVCEWATMNKHTETTSDHLQGCS